MIKYTIAMSVRVLCIVALLFAHGWWLVVFAAGAILLPYFAVVIANVHSDPRGATVVRPGGVEVYRPDSSPYDPAPQPPTADAKEPSGPEDGLR